MFSSLRHVSYMPNMSRGSRLVASSHWHLNVLTAGDSSDNSPLFNGRAKTTTRHNAAPTFLCRNVTVNGSFLCPCGCGRYRKRIGKSSHSQSGTGLLQLESGEALDREDGSHSNSEDRRLLAVLGGK